MIQLRKWIACTILDHEDGRIIRQSDRNICKKIRPVVKKRGNTSDQVMLFLTPPRGSDSNRSYLSQITSNLVQATWSRCFMGEAGSKPTSSNRRMAYCEGCNDWYHFACVNIQSQSRSYWLCKKCTGK